MADSHYPDEGGYWSAARSGESRRADGDGYGTDGYRDAGGSGGYRDDGGYGGYREAAGYGDRGAGYETADDGAGDDGTGDYGAAGYGSASPGRGGYDTGRHSAGRYDTGGYDSGGYDTGGYDSGGYDAGGYDAGGYDSGGYDAGGYDTGRYDTGRYDTGSQSATSHRPGGYDAGGYRPGGYGAGSHNAPGRRPEGYGSEGYGSEGYGSEGYGSEGYGPAGYTDSAGYGDNWYGAPAGYGGPVRPGGYPETDGYGGGYASQNGSSDSGDDGQGRGRHSPPRPADDDRLADRSYGQDPGYRQDDGQGWSRLGQQGVDRGPRSYDQAESGRHAGGDSGTFDRTVSGGYDRPAGRAAARRPGRDQDADQSAGGRSGRSGRNGEPPANSGTFARLPEPSASSASWRGEPDDSAEWQAGEEDGWEDEDGGLLSRRFGREDGGGQGGGGRGGRSGRPRRARGRVASLIAVLAVLVIIGGAGFFAYRFVHSWIEHRYGDYAGPGTGHVQVVVPDGSNLVDLGPTLLKDHVIEALRPYDIAAGKAVNASTLQPGIYGLRKHMNAALAVQLLLSGKTRLANKFIVLPDARAADIAANLVKATGLPLSQFTQLIEHPPASLGLPAWAAGQTAEGFLFPDTYELPPHPTAQGALRLMVDDFNNRIAPLSLPGAAARVFTTPFHVLIVASLIQAEGNATDFSKISRVIWNRLKDGMRLQLDSTVFYAMHTYGTSITKAEEKFNSPYNTYLHAGLPPGPIGSPSLAAIQAALHPATGSWLYFITDVKSPTHRTYFTDSLSQFQKWQREFGS